jgi:hypothetical protein
MHLIRCRFECIASILVVQKHNICRGRFPRMRVQDQRTQWIAPRQSQLAERGFPSSGIPRVPFVSGVSACRTPSLRLLLRLLAGLGDISTKCAEVGRAVRRPSCDYAFRAINGDDSEAEPMGTLPTGRAAAEPLLHVLTAPLVFLGLTPCKSQFFEAIQCSRDGRL